MRQLNHINIEPIEDVKNILEQMDLSGHVRLLDNVCSFADSLRSHSRSHSVRPASIVNVPVKINVTLAAEDLTDKELQESQLDAEHLRYARQHPIDWSVPTHILYGENDNLTSLATISDFARRTDATLEVMPNGEHWFHTPEQMAFLDGWITTRHL